MRLTEGLIIRIIDDLAGNEKMADLFMEYVDTAEAIRRLDDESFPLDGESYEAALTRLDNQLFDISKEIIKLLPDYDARIGIDASSIVLKGVAA